MSTFSKTGLGLGLSILTYLAFWPTGIEAVAWDAAEPPSLTGIYEANNALQDVEWIGKEVGYGGEDVAIDAEARIYTGYSDGRIVRFNPDGQAPETLVNTGGRPLGLDFDNNGNLVIADAELGLLRLSPEGQLETLSTGTDTYQLVFADDVDVAPDGRIYFSDASHKYDRHNLKKDVIEHRPNGLLLRYNPESKSTEILMRDLYFANGIAVSPDNSFVLVVETTAYRIRKYWLTAQHKPQTEIIIDNLPGMPDGISTGQDGRYWFPLVLPRNPLLDKLSQFPKIREALLRFPKFMQPKGKRYAFVIAIDATGKLLHNLQDPAQNAFAPISSVEEFNGKIYLGTLSENAIARIALP